MNKLRHRNEEELAKAVVSIQQKLGLPFASPTPLDHFHSMFLSYTTVISFAASL